MSSMLQRRLAAMNEKLQRSHSAMAATTTAAAVAASDDGAMNETPCDNAQVAVSTPLDNGDADAMQDDASSSYGSVDGTPRHIDSFSPLLPCADRRAHFSQSTGAIPSPSESMLAVLPYNFGPPSPQHSLSPPQHSPSPQPQQQHHQRGMSPAPRHGSPSPRHIQAQQQRQHTPMPPPLIAAPPSPQPTTLHSTASGGFHYQGGAPCVIYQSPHYPTSPQPHHHHYHHPSPYYHHHYQPYPGLPPASPATSLSAPTPVTSYSFTSPHQQMNQSTENFAALVQQLSTSDGGGGGGDVAYASPTASNTHIATPGYHVPPSGVEAMPDVPGCEIFHYCKRGYATVSPRLHGIFSFDQLMMLGDVQKTLETHANVAKPQGANTFCFNGPRGSGIATAIHLYCRNNGINLIDCHNDSGLPLGWDATMVRMVETIGEPWMIMMHRFDTLWEMQTRFENMGRLCNRWSSLARTSTARVVRTLVWVTSTGGIENIYPPYKEMQPLMPTAVVKTADWHEDDVAKLLRDMLKRRGHEDALSDEDVTALAGNVDVLHSPGRINELVCAAVDACDITRGTMLRMIASMRAASIVR